MQFYTESRFKSTSKSALTPSLVLPVKSQYLLSAPVPAMFLPAPNPSITGGATRNLAIDTIAFNLYLDTTRAKKGFFQRLHDLKSYVQGTKLSSVVFDFDQQSRHFSFNDGHDVFSFNLSRTGVKFYPYVLSCGDVSLCLSARDGKRKGSMPSAKLQIGSISSQKDPQRIIKEIEGYLSLMGIFVVRNTVSRVDVCHDFMEPLSGGRIYLSGEDHVVTVSRNYAQYRASRKLTGVQFGSGLCVLRVYDKIAEIKGSSSDHKKKFFEQKWVDIIGDDQEKSFYAQQFKDENQAVTRVEFQLRKKFLDDFLKKDGSYFDFLQRLPEIWHYLTHDWFRITAEPVDRKNNNQDKARISCFWDDVQSLTCVVCAYRSKSKQLYKSEKGLRDQLRGLLVTLCAGKDYLHTQFFSLLNAVQDIATEEMTKAMNSPLWAKDFNTRQNNFILSF